MPATFLPGQKASCFTTLRHRTLTIGKRIETAEKHQHWHEKLDYQNRKQLELDMSGDPAGEFVFSVDIAHIPLVRHEAGRTFDAVVGHCGRGGRGSSPGPLFAFGGVSVVTAAGIISIGSWLMIASGAICGQIVDRFGRRDLVLAACMTGAVMALWLPSLPGAGMAASLLFGLVGMASAGVIMALAGLALRPDVCAFGMGVFFTIYYAIMLAMPPVAVAIFDVTGQPQSPILLAVFLFASVVPFVLTFTLIKSRPKHMGQ